MSTTVKTFAIPVNNLLHVNTLSWANQSWGSNQILTGLPGTTNWYSMNTTQNTNIDRFFPCSWDGMPHYFYFKLDCSNRNQDYLILDFRAGCTRCDSTVARKYMRVLPVIKRMHLSHTDELKVLEHTENNVMDPLYNELTELHRTIDNLYLEDYRQQRKLTIKF